MVEYKSLVCFSLYVGLSYGFLFFMAYLQSENQEIASVMKRLSYNLSESSTDKELFQQSQILSKLDNRKRQKKHFASFKSLPSRTIIEPTSYNRTFNSSRLLFYTAVPKTGSTLLGLILLEKQDSDHKIYINGHKVLPMQRITQGYSLEKDLKWFAESYVSQRKWNVDLVSIEHRCYFEVETFGVPKKFTPSWIGSVRDPIDRQASLYYFKTRPKRYKPNSFKLNFTDFDECVNAKHPDCLYEENAKDRFQFTFFCGNAPECFESNQKSLQLAKWNAEHKYAVITILEDMKESISVLEQYLPRFFNNTTEIFKSILNTKNPSTFDRITNRNPLSKSVKERTRKILMENPAFQLEFDFYYFVKRRMHLQSSYVRYS